MEKLLIHKIKELDDVEERKIFVEDNNKTQVLKGYKAIWNTTRNRLSCVATDEYTIIKHRKAFEIVIDTLNSLGLKYRGKVTNYGDEAYLYVVFDLPKAQVIVQEGDIVAIGIKFSNSYNMQKCFTAEMFAERLICKNGMVLADVFPDMTNKHHHKGIIAIKTIIKKYIKNVINKNSKLYMIVNECLKDTIEWQAAEQIFNKLITIKKHRTKIVEMLKRMVVDENKPKLNRWDIYNIITQYITHGENISRTATEYLNKKAQYILVTPLCKSK